MDLKVLENIVVNQNKIIDQMDPGFTRDKLEDISKLINKTNIVITGHRRVGKSTLLLQIMQKYFKNYMRFFKRITEKNQYSFLTKCKEEKGGINLWLEFMKPKNKNS